MEEFIIAAYEKYVWLHWLIIMSGAGFAYVMMLQVKRIFLGVDEEMWEND